MKRVSVAHRRIEVAGTQTGNAAKELDIVAEKRKKCAEKLKTHTDTTSQHASAKVARRWPLLTGDQCMVDIEI